MYASRRWVIVLFTIAFLVARVTGAHLHLCLDGSEPLAQLHVSDTAEVDHHYHEPGHDAGHEAGHDGVGTQSHEDVDVDALGNVLAKVVKLDLSLIALLACSLALIFVFALPQPIPEPNTRSPWPPPRYLRPLLRGPPV
jgi:hypothetical protein